MSDAGSDPDGRAAEPQIDVSRRGRLSLVWLVPVFALLVTAGVVWRTYSERGPIVTVRFDAAQGVRAEETQLRYRDVVVGLVENVRFSGDLGEVLVEIRVDKEVAPFIDADASFWIVAPEISAQGVSGIDTVLNGVYMEGSWDSEAGPEAREFEGVERPPLRDPGQDGVSFQLRSNSVSGISENAPIIYRGINVGRIGNIRLGDDGVSVLADAFVRAPESRLINSATRFWDTSGFQFSLGANGARLDVNSLASLVSGGVAFETLVSGGVDLGEDPVFRLYGDEAEARASIFGDTGGEPVSFTVIFDETVPGLEVDADVEFGGIRVGRVAALTGVLDEEQFGDRGVRLLTTVELQPGQMGLDPGSSPEEVLDFMEFAVQSGLRAQLQSASLLGGLVIALEQFDDVPPAEIDTDAEPFPRVPSVQAELSDFADTAEGVFNRINNLPIEELLSSAIDVLDNVNAVLASEGTRETPEAVLALIQDVRALIASEAVQNLPGQAAGTMAAFQNSAEELERIIAELAEVDAVGALVDALEAAEEAADEVYIAVDEVPETLDLVDEAVAELETLIATVNRLPLESVVGEVEGSVAALRQLLASEATQGLTGDVSELLTTVEGLVGDIRAAGIVETANATMEEVTAALGRLEAELTPLLAEARTTLAQAQRAVAGVPALINDLSSLANSLDIVVDDVAALPLDTIAGNVDAVLGRVDALLAGDAAQAVPGNVNALLGDARQLLSDLSALVDDVRDAGLTDTANATLADLRGAINEVVGDLRPILANASESVPQVLDNVENLSGEVDDLLREIGDLPLDDTVTRLNSVLSSVDELVSSEATRGMPGRVNALLVEARDLVEQLAESGLIEEATRTVVTTNGAIAQLTESLEPVLAEAERAARQVAAAADAAPEIAERAKRVADQIELFVADIADLPLPELADRATTLLDSANALVASEDTQRLPGAAADALGEIERLLIQIQDGGLIENANGALVSVNRAATRLPGVLDSVGVLLTQTGTVISGYEAQGQLGAEVRSTLREIAEAAQSVDSLARQIERAPNSLLFGR